MLTVIIDTNVWDRSRAGTTSAWKRLRRLSRDGEVRVVIPAVVRLEIERHIRRARRKGLKAITDAVRQELVHSDPGLAMQISEAADANSDVEDIVSTHFESLTTDRIVFPDFPAVSHRTLVGMDLAELQPFDSKGRGYRDALIWHTVLAEATRHDELVLITEDVRDFCEGGSLDRGLSKDLLDQIPSSAEIDHFVSLNHFLEARFPTEIQGALEAERPQAAPRDEGEYADFFAIDPTATAARTLAGLLSGELTGLEVARGNLEHFIVTDLLIDNLDIPSQLDEELTIVHAEPDLGSFHWQLVDHYQTELLIEASFDVETVLDGYISKVDYAGLTSTESAALAVMDADWNDHVMWIQIPVDLRVTVASFVDPEMGTVREMTIEKAEFLGVL